MRPCWIISPVSCHSWRCLTAYQAYNPSPLHLAVAAADRFRQDHTGTMLVSRGRESAAADQDLTPGGKAWMCPEQLCVCRGGLQVPRPQEDAEASGAARCLPVQAGHHQPDQLGCYCWRRVPGPGCCHSGLRDRLRLPGLHWFRLEGRLLSCLGHERYQVVVIQHTGGR